MNNIYSKIYNAINEGVVKSLQIDDDSNNVTYSHIKMNNETYTKEEFDNAVKNFIKNSSAENYNKILKYSMFGMHQYKITDFQKLNDAFNKVLELTDDINLSWIDTTNVLTFIMKNGDELSLDDIDNVNNVMFVKFNDKQNFFNPIIIHKDLLISAQQKWSNVEVITYPNGKRDGYENTYSNNIINDLDNYPVFEYCINQSTDEYEGYLPAIDELTFLSKNGKLINYILKYVKGKELNIGSDYWWSSTQYSAAYAWVLDNGTANSYGLKSIRRYALPFFKKID